MVLCQKKFFVFHSVKIANNANHGDAFSLRLRLHYKVARVGGVRRQQIPERAPITIKQGV